MMKKAITFILLMGFLTVMNTFARNVDAQFYALYGTSTSGQRYISVVLALSNNRFYYYSPLRNFESDYTENNGVISVRQTPKGYQKTYYADSEDGRRVLKIKTKSWWIVIPRYEKFYPIEYDVARHQIACWDDRVKEK